MKKSVYKIAKIIISILFFEDWWSPIGKQVTFYFLAFLFVFSKIQKKQFAMKENLLKAGQEVISESVGEGLRKAKLSLKLSPHYREPGS